MTEQKKVEREGAGAAETSRIAAGPAPAHRRRLTAARKQEAVLRVLRGEAVELVARSIEATAADVSRWRDAFLEAGASGLKHRPRDARDEEIDRLRATRNTVILTLATYANLKFTSLCRGKKTGTDHALT